MSCLSLRARRSSALAVNLTRNILTLNLIVRVVNNPNALINGTAFALRAPAADLLA